MVNWAILFSASKIRLSRHENNFDFLRLFAAILVIISHSSVLLLNKPFLHDPIKSLFGMDMGRFGVICFFIISGFLICRSWENKKSIISFSLARVLRIYPAAIVIVLLSVILLGPCLTTLNINDYFKHPNTHLYLQNSTLYRMYYQLPGVFTHNPSGNSVNGSLWTLAYEFTCYAFLGLLGLLKFLKQRNISLVVFLVLLLLNFLAINEINKLVIPILGIDFKTFYPLFLYFMAGAVFYKFRSFIPFNLSIGILLAFVIFFTKQSEFAFFIKSIALPYIILAIAFSPNIPLKSTGKWGDFSYGLYLYAFPIQQVIVFVLGKHLNLLSMIFLSIAFTLPFAAASWKFIEKPCMSIKQRLHPKL